MASSYVELARSSRAILEARVTATVADAYRVLWLNDEGFTTSAISFDHGKGAEGLERAITAFRTGEVVCRHCGARGHAADEELNERNTGGVTYGAPREVAR